MNQCSLNPSSGQEEKDNTTESPKKVVRTKWQILIIRSPASGDVPGGAVVKNPPANAGDTGSIPGLGRSHILGSN